MKNDRASGILLHPTSLPGKYGIGTLGKACFDFIDFLVRAGQTYWQILPLGPTGYADSPYQCFSAHAGNPNLIDLDLLVKSKLLEGEDLEDFPHLSENQVEFDAVQKARLPILKKAFERFLHYADNIDKMAYRNFLKEQSKWINDYALFMAIKSNRGQRPWYQWEESLKMRDPEALRAIQTSFHEEIDFHKFLQYVFFRQWMVVKEYAHKYKIRIIGDIHPVVLFSAIIIVQE